MLADRRKLALHRLVVEHIIADPVNTREIGLNNIAKLKSQYSRDGWGTNGLQWVEDWERLLNADNQDLLLQLCLSESQYACDMRQVSPFTGVLSNQERYQAIREAHDAQW